MKKYSSATVWIFAILLLFLAATFLWNNGSMSDQIAYSEFQQKWVNDKIDSLTVQQDKMIISGKLRDGKQFLTYAPSDMLEILMTQNPKDNIKVEFKQPSNSGMWISIIPTIMLVVVMIVAFFMMSQQSQGGGGGRGVMSFGKSRAKVLSPDAKKVTFKDVAGADEEKQELEEIVDFLKQPSRYVEMGARIPKGVLLVGPPGTGKTLLAKAIAGEAGVPFYSISGSDFVEMFVGVGASRVRDLFEQAKKSAPSLIFIDEIDAVGRQRGAGLGGGHDEREQTLNQLLVEMDGFGANEGIIMIAATNRPDILDPALLRPGRFDRQIVVGAPDVRGRKEVLEVHTKEKPLEEDVDLSVLAKRTPGFSGADLENLANEAALLAVRKDKKQIGMNEFEEAITRVIAGPEKKSRTISEHDRKLTAFHEAGHAVVMKFLEHSDPVHEISIIPRGMAGGYTMNLPREDRSYTSKAKLKDDMVGLLGGRVAEKLVLSDISTGAKNDIDRASAIARAMVMEYGMSDKLGTISYGTDNNEVFLGRDLGRGRNFSEQVGSEIDKEVKSFIDEAYSKAEKLLSENMSKLHAVAETLLEKEKIDGEEFERIFDAN
ncbi:ATP-dependent zinc metalloprotease FtsH [Clostridium chauvoei]|uniref:ATP-dependent zinc metalloprotease FtsH n=1 Tax=Clostridium chauvoei JF4335 TaxID=1351755 RepID=S6F2J0_9CLOT|nr:ATP-dependent zinc metalloprotease FtsH [Clostridium chauvoei]ATD53884.1 cell division protein FtsH [Clostridium chauvoei]ATD58311.1 cell division protein FtsH [Clostridium chauvoei]MBX7280354.1 ATP-dependent zinc metalloprotease FtsH [Clostridium chauvoei]MBX7282839.1 ATP-dependent zinc metalloprotease FtsH [Clostridium chauvoei]MBX7285245.1 ATP-dependent zinc metalloprotease FtsH [Clostridium chauvoei]